MIGPYVRVECVVLTAFERLPCQDRFAGSVHRFNRFLESLRRGGDAKLAVRARNIAPMIPAINVACLCALAAYADPIRFASITKITDIDIVIASRKLAAGMDPQRDVAGAGVGAERKSSVRCVAVATGVAKEGINTYCRIVLTDVVVKKRLVRRLQRLPPPGGRNDSSRMWQKHHESKYEYDRNR